MIFRFLLNFEKTLLKRVKPKMGMGQKFGGKNRGKHGKERKKRAPAQDYGTIEMKNAALEEYYTKNGVMDPSEQVC